MKLIRLLIVSTRLAGKVLSHDVPQNDDDSGNTCYHFVLNPYSSRLPFNVVKIEIFKITILPVVLHGCRAWPLFFALKRGIYTGLFENRVVRIF
jgi:hypothetical protein